MRWVRYRKHRTYRTTPHIRMTTCGCMNMVFYALVLPDVQWNPGSSLFVSSDTSHLVSVTKGLHRFATLPFVVWKGWEDELICSDTIHYSFFASAIKLIVGFSLFKPGIATMHNHTNIQYTDDNEHGLHSSQTNQKSHKWITNTPFCSCWKWTNIF